MVSHCVRARVLRGFFLVLLILTCAMQTARAAEPPARQYHATLLNGSIVGSAFKVAQDIMVTNAHVVAGLRPGQSVRLVSPNGQRFYAEILTISNRMDLAVLTTTNSDVRIVPSARATYEPGARVLAIGAGTANSVRRTGQIANGVVISRPQIIAPFGRGVIVRMPRVRKGFSGGPVFSQSGSFVGMVAALRPSRPGHTGGREAFVLAASDIQAEVSRLMSD